ncbi:hypothetical protein CFP56_004506 [Quercus suber]|uniref:Uncharacterized protein n=1 Tax=Quercus suber TaxID=58331 RepID=A0AAW0IHI4_QUESU
MPPREMDIDLKGNCGWIFSSIRLFKSPYLNRLADVDGLIVDQLSFMLKILSGYMKSSTSYFRMVLSFGMFHNLTHAQPTFNPICGTRSNFVQPEILNCTVIIHRSKSMTSRSLALVNFQSDGTRKQQIAINERLNPR